MKTEKILKVLLLAAAYLAFMCWFLPAQAEVLWHADEPGGGAVVITDDYDQHTCPDYTMTLAARIGAPRDAAPKFGCYSATMTRLNGYKYVTIRYEDGELQVVDTDRLIKGDARVGAVP